MNNIKERELIRVRDLKQQIVEENTTIDQSSLLIECTDKFLEDIRVCVDKDGRPIKCPIRDECGKDSIVVLPILR